MMSVSNLIKGIKAVKKYEGKQFNYIMCLTHYIYDKYYLASRENKSISVYADEKLPALIDTLKKIEPAREEIKDCNNDHITIVINNKLFEVSIYNLYFLILGLEKELRQGEQSQVE